LETLPLSSDQRVIGRQPALERFFAGGGQIYIVPLRGQRVGDLAGRLSIVFYDENAPMGETVHAIGPRTNGQLF
jgi:hypothetical protein